MIPHRENAFCHENEQMSKQLKWRESRKGRWYNKYYLREVWNLNVRNSKDNNYDANIMIWYLFTKTNILSIHFYVELKIKLTQCKKCSFAEKTVKIIKFTSLSQELIYVLITCAAHVLRNKQIRFSLWARKSF